MPDADGYTIQQLLTQDELQQGVVSDSGTFPIKMMMPMLCKELDAYEGERRVASKSWSTAIARNLV